MKKNLLCSLGILAVATTLLPLTGCVPAAVVGVMGGAAVTTGMAEERGMGGVITDAGLKSEINDCLNAIDYNSTINCNLANKILVAAYQRQVVLTGTVDNEKMQIDAVGAVSKILNIDAVYDEIHVGKPTPAGQIAKDSWISTQIKTQMLFSKKIISINYEYVTHESVVYLIGIAQDQAELDEVIQIVRTIGGVKKVVSHIKLKNMGIRYQNQVQNYDHKPVKQFVGVGATMPQHHNPYYTPTPSTVPQAIEPAGSGYGPNTHSAFND